MRKILLICALLSTGAPASAESTHPSKFDQPASSKSPRVKQPRSDNSCAAYGAGFVKVEGTNTCVQIGGSIGIGATGSIRR